MQTVCEPEAPRMLAGDGAGKVTANAPRRRLALLNVGMSTRFYPLSTIKHVIGPAAQADYEIDYFAFLCRLPMTQGAFRISWFDPTENFDMRNLTDLELQAYIVRHARRYGVHRFRFSMPWDLTLDDRPRGRPWRRRPWRERGRNDTTFTRNLLWLKSMELAWNESVALEGPAKYDLVVLIRSDVFWVDDIALGGFRDPTAIYSRGLGSSYCQHEGSELPDDRVMVFGGRAAEVVLPRLWSDYYHNLSPELDSPPILGTEDWIISVARHYGIKWEFASPSFIHFPFYVALHVTKWRGPIRKPMFCLRGGTQDKLMHPRVPCINPSKVQHMFCEDGMLGWRLLV